MKKYPHYISEDRPIHSFKQMGVGPGWWILLDRLIDDLFDLGWDGCVHQVKEKFGGLRFYIGSGTDAIHDRIQHAEDESFKICEHCGTRENVHTEGAWLVTLCKDCRDEDRRTRERTTKQHKLTSALIHFAKWFRKWPEFNPNPEKIPEVVEARDLCVSLVKEAGYLEFKD